MITFGGGYALPAWVAQREGFFARHGVDVDIAYTPDSVHLMTKLIEGSYDIAVTAIDNLIAYQEGQGEVPVAAPVDLVAFMGIDHSFQNLMAARDVRTIGDLKGRELAVDALTTGYAFILKEMLARAGLGDADVRYVRTGGGPTRMQALIEGKHAAGLLATPMDLVAAESGLNRLGSARESLGHYQGRTAFARREWIRTNEAAAIGFMRAYRDAMEWLFDPQHRVAAAALLAHRDKSTSAVLAQRALEVLLHPTDGFFRDLALDIEGIKTVLALRSRFGTPSKELNDPLKYVELDLYRKAFNPN
jgi:ABC-type nitrate/sulfonate/bicarbonate transport system substrate-binding protein